MSPSDPEPFNILKSVLATAIDRLLPFSLSTLANRLPFEPPEESPRLDLDPVDSGIVGVLCL